MTQILKDTGKGFTTVLTPAAQTTTNSYADVLGSKIDTADKSIGSIAFVMQNTHVSNDLDWKVLGSIDDSTYVEVQAGATIQQSANSSYSAVVSVWRYYKVQVRATVSASQATAVVHVIAK